MSDKESKEQRTERMIVLSEKFLAEAARKEFASLKGKLDPKNRGLFDAISPEWNGFFEGIYVLGFNVGVEYSFKTAEYLKQLGFTQEDMDNAFSV